MNWIKENWPFLVAVVLLALIIYSFSSSKREKKGEKEKRNGLLPTDDDFPLEIGDNGPNVHELQVRMNTWNTMMGMASAPISEDGIFGEETMGLAQSLALVNEEGEVTRSAFESIAP